ncbi:MAG: four helix bundle protein [Minisyncoccales bacterium]
MEKDNLIQRKSFEFALSIIDLYKKLINQNEFIISKQLLRSATSIGANIEEAIGGQSRKDFIHKLAVAAKEARETRYWLKLLDQGKLSDANCAPYLDEIDEIIAVLTKIIKTTASR